MLYITYLYQYLFKQSFLEKQNILAGKIM